MRKKLALMGACAFVAALGLSPSFANHSWSGYHWARTASTFTLQVIDSATSDWDTELVGAVGEWSVAEPLDLAITSYDDSHSARKRCKAVNGQLHVCNADYGFNGWLGMASIGIDANGHIDRGVAKVNDSYSTYWTILGEKNHVICQEIGHVLGLAHTSEDGSSQQTCMDYSSDPASQAPNQHDYEELGLIYAHVDAYDSYAGGGGGGGGGGSGCNAPPGKGCNKPGLPIPMGVLVHKDSHEEIRVAARGDGGLWIHFVRLVPEAYR